MERPIRPDRRCWRHSASAWTLAGGAALLSACGAGGSGVEPAAVPATTVAAPKDVAAADAFKFLNTATFGPRPAETARVAQIGYDAWLAEQIARPPSLHFPAVRSLHPAGPGFQLQEDRMDVWIDRALNSPDQLRQRTAYALSQIFVVSEHAIAWPQVGAQYYDILVRHALGNFRDLLEEVTLSPAMGMYLSMLGSEKPDPARNNHPDENYAREVMQLFTIGLVELHPDGTARLGPGGQPIPAYDQSIVEGFAHAFTGWTYADPVEWLEAMLEPMVAVPSRHSAAAKHLLNGVTLPAGQTPRQDLEQALDNLFDHPNTGPFIGRQLIQRLVMSNPSPPYVERVARAFADNGRGVRGDMAAVVRTILTDPEALAAPNDGSGRLKEPFLRLVQLWRTYDARSASGRYMLPVPERFFAQAPLRASSVFNFYRPDYQPQVEFRAAALRQLGPAGVAWLASPEMQITTEATVVTTANALRRALYNQKAAPWDPSPTAIVIDTAEELELAGDPAALVDRIATKLLAGNMSPALRGAAIVQVTRVPPEDRATRVAEALYLIATSPEFAVVR